MVSGIAVGGDQLDEYDRVAGVVGWRPQAQPQQGRADAVADDQGRRATVRATGWRGSCPVAPGRVGQCGTGRVGRVMLLGVGGNCLPGRSK
jgi:hypothetical protein